MGGWGRSNHTTKPTKKNPKDKKNPKPKDQKKPTNPPNSLEQYFLKLL